MTEVLLAISVFGLIFGLYRLLSYVLTGDDE